jgi:phenylacetate-CoA ligase
VPIERIEDDCTFAVLSQSVAKESEAEACRIARDAAGWSCMTNLIRLSYYLFEAMGRLRWKEGKIRKYQNKRLRKVVKNAFENVPFYKQLFRAARVHPSDIRTVDDLNKLPIIRKSDMKNAHVDDLISKAYNVNDLKVIRTGGSTGEPFSVYISEREDDWRKANYMRANISCGQRPRDRWVAVMEAERAAETTHFQRRVGVFAQNIVPVTWKRTAQLEYIEKMNPNVLDGDSGVLWLLAKEAELHDLKSIHPRIIFGSNELIDRHSRKYIGRVFGAPYYDQYGSTEIDRCAWQCPEQLGYHMDTDSVIMQFVDEEGEEVGLGEKGEIVCTSLFNYVMPFIRFNLQDVGVPAKEECSCGRRLPLMELINGRRNSFLVFPDNQVVAPMSFVEMVHAYSFVKEIGQYRVIQKRKDLVEIYVKKVNDSVDEKSLSERLLTNILKGLAEVEKVDVSKVRFEVKFVGEIPLSLGGKLNVIVSYVQSDLK